MFPYLLNPWNSYHFQDCFWNVIFKELEFIFSTLNMCIYFVTTFLVLLCWNSMHMIINTKLWKAVPTSHIQCSFPLFNVLVACVFTFLFWFRKYSGHIFCCYFLKKYGNQVGRLVHPIMYVLVLLLFFLALPPSVFLSIFLFFSALIFFPLCWLSDRVC